MVCSFLLKENFENSNNRWWSFWNNSCNNSKKIKFFTPDSNWSWYVVEYDKYEKIFFGFVNGHYPEWGYFSLEELEQTKGPLGLHIERDIHFKEQPFGQIKELQ